MALRKSSPSQTPILELIQQFQAVKVKEPVSTQKSHLTIHPDTAGEQATYNSPHDHPLSPLPTWVLPVTLTPSLVPHVQSTKSVVTPPHLPDVTVNPTGYKDQGQPPARPLEAPYPPTPKDHSRKGILEH